MGIFDSKEDREARKQKELEQYGKRLSIIAGNYVGGNLSIIGDTLINIAIYEYGIMINKMFIPYHQLDPAEIKTEEQISKDVTLTRLLLVGVFAFGLKKKKVSKDQYLIISYRDENNTSYNGVFKIGRLYLNAVKIINDARSAYLNTHSDNIDHNDL